MGTALSALTQSNTLLASVATATLLYVCHEARNWFAGAYFWLLQLVFVEVDAEHTSRRRTAVLHHVHGWAKRKWVHRGAQEAGLKLEVRVEGLYFIRNSRDSWWGFVYLPSAPEKWSNPHFRCGAALDNAVLAAGPPIKLYVFSAFLPAVQAFLETTAEPPVQILSLTEYDKEHNAVLNYVIAHGSPVQHTLAHRVFELAGTTDRGVARPASDFPLAFLTTFPNGVCTYVTWTSKDRSQHNARANVGGVSATEVWLATESHDVGVLVATVKNVYDAHQATLFQNSSIPCLALFRYRPGYYGGKGKWKDEGRIPGRLLNTIALPQSLIRAILHDITDFQGSQEWYLSHCIPYRRGYLLHGPPGTGKTSLVRALATYFKVSLSVVCASDVSTDECLLNCLRTVTPHSFLLMEDIDSLLPASAMGHRNAGAHVMTIDGGVKDRSLTASGVLNALDGMDAAMGRIVFMTTNDLSALSEAFVRNGRCDKVFEIGYADREQASVMFSMFYPGASPETVRGFVNEVLPTRDCTIMPAKLQEHFIKHRTEAECVTHAHDVQVGTSLLNHGNHRYRTRSKSPGSRRIAK